MSAANTKSPKDPSGGVGDVIRPSSRTSNEQDTENIENIDNSLHDVGYGYFLESQDMDPVLRDEIAKRVLKKIDFCLLPAMCFIYLLSFLDKQTLNYTNAKTAKVRKKAEPYQPASSRLSNSCVIFGIAVATMV